MIELGEEILVDWHNGLHKYAIKREDQKKAVYVDELNLYVAEPVLVQRKNVVKGWLKGIYGEHKIFRCPSRAIKFSTSKGLFVYYDDQSEITDWPHTVRMTVDHDRHMVYICK